MSSLSPYFEPVTVFLHRSERPPKLMLEYLEQRWKHLKNR